MTIKINLPSVPRSADRDTTVFFQAIRKALDTLASTSAGNGELSAKSRGYIQQINKKTNQEIAANIEDALGIGNLLDLLNGQITNSQLHKDLGERIEKITSNENAISQERLDRVAEVLAANNAIIAERQDRVKAITDSSDLLQQDIEAEVIARINAINDTKDSVIAERDARLSDVSAANTAIEAESRNRIDAIIRANTLIGDERDARVAAIANEAEKRVTDNAVISETLNGVFAQVNPRLAGDTDWLAGDEVIQVGVWTEQSARIEDDFALGQRIDTLNSEFKDSNALIQTKQTTLADASQALAERTDVISAKTEDNAAAINTESRARTELESSVSEKIELLTATTGNNTASIESEQTARADADSALTQRVDSLVATTGSNSALIQSESQARADADSALSSRVDTLVSTTGANTASIQDVSEAITTKTTANARRIDGLYAQVNPDMAGDIDKWAGDDSYFAGVWSERSAIIEKDMAMSKRTDGLLSSINDNKATITEVNKTLVTKNEVVASQINRLAAQMTGGYSGDDLSQLTSGLIHQERTARATEIEGLAEQVSLLSAGVGEQFDSFEIWHFDKNHDGWVNGVYANGWINVRTETINSPVVNINGSMYRHVKLRIQKVGTPTWGALLTYSGGSLSVPEPEYTQDGFTIVNFYLEWSGTITGFNIKLASVANNLNYFKIDWIAIGRPSPGASHAALLREEKVRADKDLALTQQFLSLDSQINGDDANSSSSIVQKLNTTATKTDATAEDLSNLTSTFNDEVMGAQGVVARNAQTAASASAANASDISGVFAQVNPRMAGDINWWAGDSNPVNGVGVWSERSARMEAGFATGQRFDAVLAKVDGNSAAISLESKVRTDEIKAIAEQTETIRVDFTGRTSNLSVDIKKAQDAADAAQADASAAKKDLGDISADSKLTSVEKKQVGTIWNEIKKTDSSIRAKAVKYGLSITAYNNAYVALNNYLTPYMANTSTTSSINRTTFDTVFANLYARRAELDAAIISAIKTDTNTLSENAAVMQQKITAVADDNSALLEQIDTIQTTVGQNTSSVQVAQKSIDGINAKWSIKTDVNGVVGGLGVENDGRTVNFIIRASNFAIAAIGGSSATPFIQTTEVQYINGQRVPIGSYMDTAFIMNGSMTTAKIGHAQIDTLQLAGEAVIIPRVQFTASDFNFYTIDTEEVINSITIDAQGGGVSISFGFEKLYAPVNVRGINPNVILRIKRGSTVLRTLRYETDTDLSLQSFYNNGSLNYRLVSVETNRISQYNITLPTILDVPPAGSQTYTVTLESRGLNAGKSKDDRAENPVVITARSFHIIGAKR